MRHEGMAFELYSTNYYVNKVKSSKDRGIDFALTYSEVRKLLSAKRCKVTGRALEHDGLWRVTIDRIDNSKGYVKGNVAPVAHVVNEAKAFFEGREKEYKINPNEFIRLLAKYVGDAQ